MSTTLRARLVAAATAAALLVSVAACGDDDTADDGSTTTTVAEASFPVTVAADNGDVEIAAAPGRIVSLSPSLTEMLYAIDAGSQVVAVDRSSNFPEGTPLTDMSGFRPNVEAIGGYEPDLVLVSGDRDGIVAALESLGVPTLVLGSAGSLDDVYEQIGDLGDATGHPAEADALVQRLAEDLGSLSSRVEPRDEPLTYLYEVSDDLHSVTSDTFVGGLLGLVGLESIADDAGDTAGGFPQLTNEFVLDAAPDYIFLTDVAGAGFDPASIASRPGWAELQAVQEGRVVVLPDDIASRWGPRIVELLEAVVAALTAPEAGGGAE